MLDRRPAKRDLDLPVPYRRHRARRQDTMRTSQQPRADNQIALPRRVASPRDATCGAIRREHTEPLDRIVTRQNALAKDPWLLHDHSLRSGVIPEHWPRRAVSRLAYDRSMRVSLNRQKNIAYFELTEHDDADVARSRILAEHDIEGEFRFDFDKKGRLLGFEVKFAAQGLPTDLLDSAETTTRFDQS
jgi:uncharacterized protein YuzE